MATRVVGNFVGNGLLLIGKFHQCSGEGTHSCFGECSLLLEGTYSWCIYNRYIHRICLNDNGKLLPTTFVPTAKTVKWHLMWSLTLFKGAVSVCLILYHWAISAAISYRARLSTPIYILDTRKLFCRNFHQISGPNSMFLLACHLRTFMHDPTILMKYSYVIQSKLILSQNLLLSKILCGWHRLPSAMDKK